MNSRTLSISWAAVIAALVFFITLNNPILAVEEDQTLQYSVSTTVLSKYLSPGMGVNLSDQPVIQSDITCTWDKFTFFVWASHDMEGKYGDSFGDEIDYGVIWFDKGFSLGVIYFDEPNTTLTGMGFGANDIVYSFAGYTHDMDILSVSAVWENYYVPFGGIYSGGNLFSLGIKKSFELCRKVSLSLKSEMSYGDGAFGTTAGLFNRNLAELVWSVNKNVDVKLTGRLYAPLVHDYREPDASVALGIVYRF